MTIWPRVSGLLERAVKYSDGRFGLRDVKASITLKKRQLWVTWPDCDCALVTELSEYPQKKMLTIFALAGNFPADWKELLRNIEGWGKSMGCTGVEMRGRKGWIRLLGDYKVGLVELTKELR